MVLPSEFFNTDRKQYDVLETIPFLSELEPEKEQLTFFSYSFVLILICK